MVPAVFYPAVGAIMDAHLPFPGLFVDTDYAGAGYRQLPFEDVGRMAAPARRTRLRHG